MVIDIKDRVKNVDLQGKIVTAYGFTPSGYAKVVHWHWQNEWKKNHSKSICGQVLP